MTVGIHRTVTCDICRHQETAERDEANRAKPFQENWFNLMLQIVDGERARMMTRQLCAGCYQARASDIFGDLTWLRTGREKMVWTGSGDEGKWVPASSQTDLTPGEFRTSVAGVNYSRESPLAPLARELESVADIARASASRQERK